MPRELDWREIDSERDVHWPFLRLPASSGQRPTSQRMDQTHFLRSRDEVAGRNARAIRSIPAQQSLKGTDLSRPRVDERLVIDLKFAVRDGVSQIQLQSTTALQHLIQGWFKESEAVASVRLRLVERQVSAFEQLVRL